MARLLISYRREDTAGHAGRLYDILVEHFGSAQVFRDVDTIAPGDDFVEIIEKSIGAADVVIALIGREWLSAANPDGRRRLDDPDDFVRLELAKALERNVRVVPVLVQGATMPAAKDLPESLRALARRNAFTVTDQAFRRDASALVESLEQAVSPSEKPPVGVLRRLTRKHAVIMGAALVSAAIGVVAIRQLGQRDDGALVRPTDQKTAAPPSPSTPVPPSEPAKPPIVLNPQHGSRIAQPYVRPWVFQWAPGRPNEKATYEVTLGRVGMTREYKTTTTGLTWDPKLCGIGAPGVSGWWLRVKATLSDGSTAATESYFSVVPPVDFAEYCRGCPDSRSCASKPTAPGRPAPR